ncbi:MAG TPA: GNAT family N-acetyltransferase [Chitinophagaceae bacterium]
MQSPLLTERLSITNLNTTDAKFIFELVNTEGWLTYIGDRNIHSPEDARSYIQKIIDSSNISYWVVRLRQDDTPAGIISLINRDHLEYPDIGFAFLPSFTSKGYAHEATEIVLKHFIDNTKHPFVLGVTVVENTASISLLKKLGFQFQKELEVKKEKLLVYVLSKDKFDISEITKRFFDSFTNRDSSTPKLDTLKSICMPDVRIVSINGSENIYTLNSFLEPRKKMLTDGTLIEFEEKEVYEKTNITQNIAHRHSKYEKNGVLNGKKFNQTGHKLFQFIKTNQDWKIKSVIWEDDKMY